MVNENAHGLVAGFVGVIGHIGVRSLNTSASDERDYFANLRLTTGATVILGLPEQCIDEASRELGL
jgi:hypothetical protein